MHWFGMIAIMQSTVFYLKHNSGDAYLNLKSLTIINKIVQLTYKLVFKIIYQ